MDPVTADLVHLFRVPGTSNRPNSKKATEGRKTAPAKLLKGWDGTTIQLGDLEASLAAEELLKPTPKASRKNPLKKNRFWTLPKAVQNMILRKPEPFDDRSVVAYAAVAALFQRGWSPDEIRDIFTDHMGTIGAHYEGDLKRMGTDINNIFEKLAVENPWLPDQCKTGNPKTTIANVKGLLDFCGIDVRYNKMTRKIEVSCAEFPRLTDAGESELFTLVNDKCQKLGIKSNSQINDFVVVIAKERGFCPVQHYIVSREWDGQSRLPVLLETLAVESKYEEMKKRFVTKWLVSAVAAVFEENFSAQGVLILQGQQGIGKTRWLSRLFSGVMESFIEGVFLDPKDKDCILGFISKWAIEIGELGATFRKADIDRLKAIITQSKDEVRKPYARSHSTYARRTVFCGSVNDFMFLVDQTGNRRFWPIACESIEYDHDIDMQQLWAEVYETMYSKGYIWWLNREDEMILTEYSQDFVQVDPFEEMIDSVFNFKEPESTWEFMPLMDILKRLESSFHNTNFSKYDTRKIAAVLRKRNLLFKRNNKCSTFRLPTVSHVDCPFGKISEVDESPLA